MSIELTPEQQAIIQSRVDAGFYESPAAMIDKAITVLEELDKFKRGNEDINFQAREFLRRIDAFKSLKFARHDELDANANSTYRFDASRLNRTCRPVLNAS